MEIGTREFERALEQLVEEEAPGPAREAPGAPAEEAERLVGPALRLFYRGDYPKCLRLLQGRQGQDGRITALWGASLALAAGDVRRGLQACLDAIRREPGFPDGYCALGTLLLRSGERAKARRVFLKGLTLDPRHPQLRASVRTMGMRRSPVLRFLDRSHPLNRTLGLLRARLG